MKKLLSNILTLCLLLALSQLTDTYPVESKPLNNNPDTWNFGDGWLIFNPRNSADPSAEALISSDPHIKKSKITPKSIFIAPSVYTVTEKQCPHGYRIDNNGECIKTVTINQDDVLAARISELFGVDTNPSKGSDIDSDYYDFDDDSKSEKDSGPLQINLTLPLIDIEEEVDGQKVEYVVEEKFVVRNLNPKDVLTTTTAKVEEASTTVAPEAATMAVVTDEVVSSTTLVSSTEEQISTEEPTIVISTEEPAPGTRTEEQTPASFTEEPTTLMSTTQDSTTVKDDEVESTSTVTDEPVAETTSTEAPTTTTTTSTTTRRPTKIFSVDFMPKSQRKSSRLGGESSARLKASRDRDKFDRPRKQKTTVASLKSASDKATMTKLYKIEREQVPKKNRTRNGSSKRPNRKLTTTTEIVTESTTTATTQKPFWWLPKGWSIDETREKPVLVRFWSQQPLHDDRARSHNANRQRANSKMPTDNIFREITAPELMDDLKRK